MAKIEFGKMTVENRYKVVDFHYGEKIAPSDILYV